MRVRFAVFAALGALAAGAAVGCGGGGGGGLTGRGGSGGGFSGFGGFGLSDGGPADGGGSTGTDGPPLQPAPPICGNGIVEAVEACDGAAVTGCAAGQRCGQTCTCVAGPPAPTDSRALIAQARAAGRIDYFTSLLYRAYLLVGDGRLPAEYDGDFTVDEDTALFLEVSRLWGTLTPAQQQQLLPYVVRPNDPASAYSTPPPVPFFGDDGDLRAAGGSDDINCPIFAQNGLADWRYNATTHFVVWSCGSGDAATDPNLGKRQAVAALAEQVWALEVPGMGPPRDDADTEDPQSLKRIDIYLVPLNQCIRRDANAGCGAVTSATTIAAAAPDAPCDRSRGALTSSGYVLMRLDLVPAAPPAGGAVKARSDLAHEFFHLLTYGLNLEAQGGDCRDRRFTGPIDGKTSWLTEASATWAEWAYTPTDNPEYRAKKFRAFQDRFPEVVSLLDTDLSFNAAYEAYVYPLFLSQEAGGRMPFEAFWKGASGPRTREALDDLLNTRFPFDQHFRDFGVKMLNKTLPGDPIAPLLSAFDAAVPAGVAPTHMPPTADLPTDVHDTDLPFAVSLAPLAAQIQLFTVPPETRWVDIDLSDAAADLMLGVVANVNGTWKRRPVDGQRFTFCRDDPADDISELYLVIANTAHREGARADEDYKVKTRTVCPGTLSGWIQSENTLTKYYIEQNNDVVNQYEQTRETWTLGMEHEIAYGGAKLPGIDAHWHGVFAHHESTVTAACQYTTTDGEGGGSHTTPLAIMEVGGGQIVLSPLGNVDPGSFDVPMAIDYEMCDGTSLMIVDPRTVYEQAGTVAAYANLTPSPGNPNRYTGSRVVLHSVMPLNGGMEEIEWVVTWDVARARR